MPEQSKRRALEGLEQIAPGTYAAPRSISVFVMAVPEPADTPKPDVNESAPEPSKSEKPVDTSSYR